MVGRSGSALQVASARICASRCWRVVTHEYGRRIEERGLTFRESYLIDPKGVLGQITMNDVSVGPSDDEALRLIQAFRFTVRDLPDFICGGWP
jgi:alkyl hydroperoxide reductase subunit AhpC